MRNYRLATVVTVLVAVFGAMGQSECGRNRMSEADRSQLNATRELTSQANQTVGMPGITAFTERQHVSMLYELRDQQDLSTYTYIVDFEGRLHHVCDSMGYGVPFSAQFTNPTVPYGSPGSASMTTLTQPEPNGLYPPGTSSATWVMCVDPAGGGFKPLYVEPSIIVSQFPLRATNSYAADN